MHLRHLHLYDNAGLVGRIPTQLGQITALTSLQLHETQVAGTVPSELGNLYELQEALLEETNLTGTMPTQVCDLVQEGSLTTLRASCQGMEAHIECECCTSCH